MKFCVFGAGAIGGYLAVELAAAGAEVSVVARGAHLAAIRRDGLRLRIGGGEKRVAVQASDDPSAFGPQDYVLCTLKAHQAVDCAGGIATLLGPATAVVVAMNGIPWWYFHRHGGPHEGRSLDSVDPGAVQWRVIGPERAIGCVVDPACEVVAPGLIEHHDFRRFTLGEPGGVRTPRVEALSAALVAAGFDAPIRDAIRWNVWLKLLGNVCFNPVSALTGAPLDRIAGEPGLSALCRTVMGEAGAVARAFGVEIPADMIDRRLAAAAGVTGHKMSMLQDLERGRSMEIDALVTAVQEMGRLAGVTTPSIDLLLALVQERAHQAGLYKSAGMPS